MRHRDQSADRRRPDSGRRRPGGSPTPFTSGWRSTSKASSSTAPWQIICCRPRSKCRGSKSSTTSRPRRTTSWASRAWAKPVRFPSAHCSPRRSRTRWSCPRAASRSLRYRSTPATYGSLLDERAGHLATANEFDAPLAEHIREAVDSYTAAANKKPGDFLLDGRHGRDRRMTTRQYAGWPAKGLPALASSFFGTHSLGRTKATLICRHTANSGSTALLRAREDRERDA